MPRFNLHTWLTAAFGLACSAAASAAEPAPVLNADAIFQNSQGHWIQQVQCAESPSTGAVCAPGACDSTSAGHGCGLCGELGDPWTLSSVFGDDPCFTVAGWFQAGYHAHSDGIFNTYPHHVQLHQGYLYAEKVADGSDGLGFGGRADVVYGTDGPNTQSFGNDPGVFDFSDAFNRGDEIGSSSHGWAIPQLYVEAAYGDVSVKMGHFYTPMGYQVVPATGNFFYSIPWTFNFSEPFTHTGALATYSASDDVTLYGGWVLGMDTGFDQFRAGNAFLGGTSIALLDNVKATYLVCTGNLGWMGEGYMHSIVFDWVINDDWEYVAQSDLVHTNLDPFGITNGYNTIGLNQYLFYTINERLRAGVRGEWWKANGVSIYDFTAGLNVHAHANLLIRPEWRYRWSPTLNNVDAADDTFNFEQGIFAVDAILTF